MMRAYALQARFLHSVSEVAGSFVEVPGRLDFPVSCRGKLLQCAVKIPGQQIAHRVKLKPDRQTKRCGHQWFDTCACSGCERAGGLQKAAARRMRHQSGLLKSLG